MMRSVTTRYNSQFELITAFQTHRPNMRNLPPYVFIMYHGPQHEHNRYCDKAVVSNERENQVIGDMKWHLRRTNNAWNKYTIMLKDSWCPDFYATNSKFSYNVSHADEMHVSYMCWRQYYTHIYTYITILLIILQMNDCHYWPPLFMVWNIKSAIRCYQISIHGINCGFIYCSGAVIHCRLNGKAPLTLETAIILTLNKAKCTCLTALCKYVMLFHWLIDKWFTATRIYDCRSRLKLYETRQNEKMPFVVSLQRFSYPCETLRESI